MSLDDVTEKEWDKARSDMVNHPPHYNQGGVECIEAIKSMLTAEEFKGYCKGNIVKYVWWSELKGQNIEDLKKSNFFLKTLIGELENL